MQTNNITGQTINNTILIVTDETQINVTQPVTNVVEVTTLGPQGPPGTQGAGIDTGSFATTGSNTFRGNQIITGSVDITGSLTVNTVNVGQNTLNFVDSNNTVLTSLSISGNNLVLSTGSFLTTNGGLTGSLFGTASWAQNVISSSYALTASYAMNGGGGGSNIDTGSFVTTSSFNAFTSSINSATSSYVTNSQTSSFVQNSQTSSFVTNSQTSSFVQNSQTSSFVQNSQTSSFVTNSQTSSFVLNSQTSSMTVATASYFNTSNLLTTGSTGTSQTISGSIIINQNLTVLGSSSVQYITSSQLNVGNNLITVNTATPAIRFGGLAVFDSGSTGTGRTGSILWDSQNDVWLYSNPSGAAYDGAMILVGPRNNTGLGNEVGITSGYAAVGDGSHHMTSSAIYSSGSLIRLENNTQITGSLNVSAGITGSFSGSVFGYVPNSLTSSFVQNSQTSSFVQNSQTSSMTVATASYVTGSIHTSTNPALSASYASSSATLLVNNATDGASYALVLASAGSTGVKSLSNTTAATIGIVPNVGRITATSVTASFTGSLIGALTGTASYATTASYALTSAGGSTISTASLLTTASATNNIITFTKGDASTFTVTVNTGSGGGAATFPYTGSAIISGSLVVTGSYSQTGSYNIYANQNSVTQADTNGILLGNTSAATVGVQSISPPIVWQGSGWKTTATAGSQDVRFRADILPVQGSTNPSATWQLSSNINNGGYTNPLTYTSNGNLNCGIISAQLQLLGVGGTYTGNTIPYYTTNGSGVYTPFMVLGNSTAIAGLVSLGYNPDSSQLAFVAGNGTYRVVRASIEITNLVNTAASESGDLIFSTKPGSPANTAITERLRITSTGNVLVGTTSDLGYRLSISGSGTSGSLRIAPSFIATSVTASSVILITGSIQQVQTASAQIYGVNVTPTMVYTTGSQTQTAFRIAPTFSGSSAFSSSQQNIIADFGATAVGTQFSVNDITSGSIYMVNDVSGLPIIEALSDWTVNMYNYPTKVFQKTGSSIIITGSMNITGSLVMAPTSSFVLPLTASTSPATGSAYWSGSFLFVYNGTRYMSASFA